MAQRHQNPSDWQDKPKIKAFPIEMTRQGAPNLTKALNIGNCAIALFRKRPEIDYLAVLEDEHWTFVFDRQEMVYWMGGLALHQDGKRMQHLVERSNGTFAERYGWNPDTVIEDYPSKSEVDVYIDHLMEKDPHQDLNDSLREDFEE